MRTLTLLFLPFLLVSFQASKIKSDWKKLKLPRDWTIKISDSATDYFDFGQPKGQLIFKNKSNTIVYYIYDTAVAKQITSGKYSEFFKGKDCQQYSSWKEGGFPNFLFKDRTYLIDLCNSAPYLSEDGDYWSLSKTLFDFINENR